MPSTDIVINLGGSKAATIRDRAAALEQLAMAVGAIKTAFSNAPFTQATGGMKNFNTEIRKATTSTKKYGTAAQNAGERTDRFGTKLGNARNALDRFRLLFMRMVRIMTAFFIISTVTRLVRDFVETITKAPMQMELWNKQLVVLSGNATLAAQRLELLKKVAIETPLELPDLFQGLTTLQAFNVEISDKTLPLLTDLAAVSGRTFQEVAEVVGKVIAGSPTAITRSLPTLAINPMEFKALAAELGSRSEALFQIIREKFEGFAKESATTVIGVISNIKDAYFVIMADIGDALMAPLRESTNAIMAWLQEIRTSPAKLRELQDKVMLVGDEIFRFVKHVWDAVMAMKEFADKIGGVTTAINVFLGFLVGRAIAAKLVALASAAREAGTAMAFLQGAINPYLLIGGIVVAGIAYWISKINEQKDALRLLTLRQYEYANELQRTNNMLAKNIQMVDAQKRANQAGTIYNMADELAAAATDAEKLKTLIGAGGRAVAAALPGPLADEATEAINRLIANEVRLNELQQRMQKNPATALLHEGTYNSLLERRGELIGELVEKYRLAGDVMIADAFQIMAAMEPPIPSMGEGTGDDTDKIDKLKEFLNFWKDGLVDPMSTQFDILQSKFDAGLITSEAAREQTARLRGLAEFWRKFFLDQQNPLVQQVGVTLTPLIGNMDQFTESLDDEITGAFQERFTDIKLQIELGLEPEAATAALTALKEEIVAKMEGLGDDLTPEMQKAFNTIITGINNAIDSLKPEDLSQAFEQTLRMVIKQGADVMAEALGSLIAGDAGTGLTQAMGKMFAGALNIMGDAMIQIGTGALLIQKLFENITSPAAAAALIAGGILLKAFANAIGSKMGDAMKNGGSSAGSAGSVGPLNYPEFSAGAYGDKRSWYVEIHAIDAQSFEQALANNRAAFGRQIAQVARDDRSTGGQAYGAFQPA